MKTIKKKLYKIKCLTLVKTTLTKIILIRTTQLLTFILFSLLVCSLPPDAGTGSQNQIQFYYDKIKNFCEPFAYKGEGGNANRFAKEKECFKNCSSTPDLLYPDKRETLCEMPSVTGSCYGRMLMWHFDSTASTCRTFIYSGCHGNGNRFSTRLECLEFCRGKSARAIGNQPVEEEPEKSAVDEGLIVGIVGGCIFVVALVAAIVVFVTQRKSHSKRRSTEVEMK
ncbi:carboxypeptidase inhibitor SmCI-like [Polyodon spathula]|uniref:carboxypeptidase inhibitor SmCI-like n=1 Tax=Polyodon spathula TaxID=7913 RepID=UPI001B7DE204|nr:carboxypeptidase inhibitor SmCI-like [Polyodon spathula]